MSIALDDLKSPDQDFVLWLARRLESEPEAVLAQLLEETLEAGAVSTRVEGGQFVALSLGAIGRSLRWTVDEEREISLSVEALGDLEELDCAGLDLDGLHVFGLSRLTRLVCSDNRIRDLDLAGVPALQRIKCSGNKLMVLDLRSSPRLTHVDCAGNEISALLVPMPSRVETLLCGRNELMVLELGDQPQLRVLNCYRNALAQLTIDSAPQLRELDCARNDLTELILGDCRLLERVDCGRNRLGAVGLPVTPHLRSLRVGYNYIESLDLSAMGHLTEVMCGNNQLSALLLADHPLLTVLQCSGNRLTDLPLRGCRALEVLECAGNELTSLDLPGGALCALDCSGNSLQSLDTSHCLGLARLYCGGNGLDEIDIRSNSELFVIDTTGSTASPKVVATDAQRHRILELRRRHGLGTETDNIAGMNSWELHDFAASYNGGDVERRLLEVVQHPHCDKGTALMIYWTNAPHYYLRYASRDEVQPYEQDGWDLLHAIEERIRAEAFAHRDIWFDPHNDKQTRSIRGFDWTEDGTLTASPTKRVIPERLLVPTGRQR